MNCTIFSDRINKEFHLILSGHLDTDACHYIQSDIFAAVEGLASDEELVVDIEHLDFISSSGLRIMLTLRKRFPHFSIINACPSVYDVFEMTGFSRMMTVQKALRHLNVDGLQEIGRGGVGIVYRISADTIVKVFNKGSKLEDIKREIDLSKEALVFGLPTAISYDIVKIDTDDDSECQYGLVYELLEADTLSNIIRKHPDKLEYYARKFGRLYKEMHSIEVPVDGIIPSAHEHEEWALDRISKYFDDSIVKKAREIIAELPSGNRLLHCDFHIKNVMLQGDELMLIDMGEIGYGNPLLDLGHTYSAMVTCVGDYKVIIGITEELGHRFFDIMLDEYFKDSSSEEKARSLEMIKKLGSLRNITWLSLSDCFPQETIEACGAQFKRLNNIE